MAAAWPPRRRVSSGDFCPGCPRNLVLLADAPTVADAFRLLATGLAVPIGAAFVVVLSRRWRSATPAARRALAPVIAAGLLLGIVTLGNEIPQLFGALPARSTAWTRVRLVAILAASLGFLWGLLRTRLARAAVGDLFVEAWRGLAGFEQRASVRTWLYSVATNRALNMLRAAKRRPHVELSLPGVQLPDPTRLAEPLWLDPYPDVLIENELEGPPGPEARYETKEAISLAFITALQLLVG